MEKRTRNCYIMDNDRWFAESYGNDTWRKHFPRFPTEHYFYDGFEIFPDPGSFRDADLVFRNYLSTYVDGCSNIWEAQPNIRFEDFHLYKKRCHSCPAPSPKCSNSFPLIFSVEYHIRADAFCGSNSKSSEVDCEKCRVNPQKSTKLAKDHVTDSKNNCSMEVSDLRLGGHAVKVNINFVSYRCRHTEQAIRTLPFLYGDSIDRSRVTKRLAFAISKSLINRVGPTYVSEACAIPLGTIKKWRERDMIMAKRNAEVAMARRLLKDGRPGTLPNSYQMTNYVCFLTTDHRSSESALLRTYTNDEWNSIKQFITNKNYCLPDTQISYPHLFLLSFDYLAYKKNDDLPIIRALLICMEYAAETNSFDRFLDFVQECKGTDRLHDIQAIFINGLGAAWDGYSPEFYRQLATRAQNSVRGNNSTPLFQNDDIQKWWEMFYEDVEIFQPRFSPPLALDEDSLDLLQKIDQMSMDNAFSIEETAVLLSYYNPALFINDFVSSEEVIFPRAETGGLDFSLIRPTGISLKLLKKMLQVGYLAKDNVQPIWRRIENTQYS